MLTNAAPTVKLAPETTPEQRCCVRDIDQALGIFWTLVERIRNEPTRSNRSIRSRRSSSGMS